ncbi:MAG: hypothetical protein H0W88_04260 [Parachlamydiaceae bacterium]|nr:hypothetical protein [Parachlamydiaceae bacterium]
MNTQFDLMFQKLSLADDELASMTPRQRALADGLEKARNETLDVFYKNFMLAFDWAGAVDVTAEKYRARFSKMDIESGLDAKTKKLFGVVVIAAKLAIDLGPMKELLGALGFFEGGKGIDPQFFKIHALLPSQNWAALMHEKGIDIISEEGIDDKLMKNYDLMAIKCSKQAELLEETESEKPVDKTEKKTESKEESKKVEPKTKSNQEVEGEKVEKKDESTVA